MEPAFVFTLGGYISHPSSLDNIVIKLYLGGILGNYLIQINIE